MAVARQFVAENYIGIGGDASAAPSPNTASTATPATTGPRTTSVASQSELWQWLENAVLLKIARGRGSELVPFEPTKYKIANVLEALKAIGHVAEAVQPPVWLRGIETTPINAGEIVPLANGILDFLTRELQAAHAGALRAARSPVRVRPGRAVADRAGSGS